MGILGRLSGRKPDYEKFVLKLMAFIQSDTWEQSRMVVEMNPELVHESGTVDDFFKQMVHHGYSESKPTGIIMAMEHWDVLRDCRRIGIEAAFAKKKGRKPDYPSLRPPEK